jgi:hypothetical protein
MRVDDDRRVLDFEGLLADNGLGTGGENTSERDWVNKGEFVHSE